jgi:hypothetical protein
MNYKVVLIELNDGYRFVAESTGIPGRFRYPIEVSLLGHLSVSAGPIIRSFVVDESRFVSVSVASDSLVVAYGLTVAQLMIRQVIG